MAWSFPDPPETVVTTHKTIVDRREWVFYVRRSEFTGWEFYPLGHLGSPESQRCKISLSRLVSLHSEVVELADLPVGWHAHRHTKSASWERSPIPTGPTHLLTFEVRPTAEHDSYGRVAGAFANCWVRSASPKDARVKADEHLSEAQWEVLEFLGQDVVTREKYVGDVNLEYYDQVQIDGEVYVFHTFEEEDE